MYIVLGATGHVGSAVARTLLDRGEAVTVVVRDRAKAHDLETRGAILAEADVGDPDALREVLRSGTRAFLLNPPADVSGDTDVEERRTAAAIVAALDGSGLEKVVAESTYGAQPGDRIGDLSVLYDFEEALHRQAVPTTIQRAAYYMSNWDSALQTALDDGIVHSVLPADLALPMVAPEDLGRTAARLLIAPVDDTGVYDVEGPARYTAQDVADAFADALGKPVRVAVTPRENWVDAYKALGFSDEAADAFARMAAVTLDQGPTMPADPIRGDITLADYIAALVAREAGSGQCDRQP